MNPQLCAACAHIPNDILILTCNHGLCTYCACSLCQNNEYICCPSCGICTYLESESSNDFASPDNSKIISAEGKTVKETEEIQKNSIPLFKQKFKQENFHERNSSKSSLTKHQNQAITKIGQRKQSVRHVGDKFVCKQHYEFELMYLCKDCDNVFICPECIIHGIHHNHQVQTIKKQFINVQEQLSLKLNNINVAVKDFHRSSQNRKEELKRKINHVDQLREQAIAKYEIIKDQLAKEQTEIIKNCCDLIYGFEKELNEIDKKIEKNQILMQRESKLLTQIINPKQDMSTKQLEMRAIQSYFQYLNIAKKNSQRVETWLGEPHQKLETLNDQNLIELSDRVQAIQEKLMHSEESNSISQSRSRKKEKTKIQKTETLLDKTKDKKKFNLLKIPVEGQNKQNTILSAANNNGNLSSKKGLKKIKKNSQKETLSNNFFVF